MKFLILTLILILWFTILFYKRKKAEHIEHKRSAAFWEKETKANTTRRMDISQLEYINIPINNLPFKDTEDESLQLIQNTIKELADKRILNLTGISNTDLKLKYGAPNINLLSEYDYHFTILSRTISQWGQYLYEHNYIQDAITVLEFGISCKTDVKNNYLLLAKIYSETNQAEKIPKLLQTAENLNSLLKNSILESLRKF